MSAVATIQFDPVFGMGSRSSYSTWPGVIESNSGLLGHDIPSYGSDTSLSPPAASRSITASPPRGLTLTPQQREIKRQRDQARREVKASRRRAESGAGLPGTSSLSITGPGSASSAATSTSMSASATASSSPPTYMQSPPVSMADMTSGPGSMPVVYTTSSAPAISLLAEPVTTGAQSAPSMAPSPYMSTAGAYSPPMHDHGNSGVFSSSYQTQPYLSEYTTGGYTTAPPPTLSSQYGRGSIQEQPNLMYHMTQQLPPPTSTLIGPGSVQATGPQAQLPHPHVGHHHGAAHGRHDSVVSAGGQGPSGVRVVQSRPKPQCWEHGCNGRQFSTFSNLLRHQREKSGQAAKAVCPNCGAEFTRTTARNGHLQHDKCKQRRNA